MRAQRASFKILHTGPSVRSEVLELGLLFFRLADKLQAFGKDLPKAALGLYPDSAPCPARDRCPERALTTMVSDLRVTCPAGDLALRAAGEAAQPTGVGGAGPVRRAR